MKHDGFFTVNGTTFRQRPGESDEDFYARIKETLKEEDNVVPKTEDETLVDQYID